MAGENSGPRQQKIRALNVTFREPNVALREDVYSIRFLRAADGRPSLRVRTNEDNDVSAVPPFEARSVMIAFYSERRH